MKKDIDDILKQYPYIGEDIQKAQKEINRYIELQQEARNPLKGQVLTGMPHDSGVSDQTYNAVEKIIDLYQVEINELSAKVNELIDRKKWLDKAYTTLTEDERRIVCLRYNDRWATWKIMRRMGISQYKTFYKILDSAKDKIKKIMFT